MTKLEFKEWTKYVIDVYGPGAEWSCSEWFHFNALKEYSLAELKEATDTLYQSNEATYLLNNKKHGYGLISLIPTISEFERVIDARSKQIREMLAMAVKNRRKEG